MSRPNDDRFSSDGFGDLAELATVRAAFREWVVDQGVDADRADELSIVFSELGANAVRATGERGSAVEASAAKADGQLVLEVRNVVDEDVDTDVSRWDLSDPLRGGGRGLMIVSALCDDLSVDHRDGWLVVRCEAAL